MEESGLKFKLKEVGLGYAGPLMDGSQAEFCRLLVSLELQRQSLALTGICSDTTKGNEQSAVSAH